VDAPSTSCGPAVHWSTVAGAAWGAARAAGFDAAKCASHRIGTPLATAP
jgi:hypothetical protein